MFLRDYECYFIKYWTYSLIEEHYECEHIKILDYFGERLCLTVHTYGRGGFVFGTQYIPKCM